MARSSVEVEYQAMTTATIEIIWLQALLQDLGFHSTQLIKLFYGQIIL